MQTQKVAFPGYQLKKMSNEKDAMGSTLASEAPGGFKSISDDTKEEEKWDSEKREELVRMYVVQANA